MKRGRRKNSKYNLMGSVSFTQNFSILFVLEQETCKQDIRRYCIIYTHKLNPSIKQRKIYRSIGPVHNGRRSYELLLRCVRIFLFHRQHRSIHSFIIIIFLHVRPSFIVQILCHLRLGFCVCVDKVWWIRLVAINSIKFISVCPSLHGMKNNIRQQKVLFWLDE